MGVSGQRREQRAKQVEWREVGRGEALGAVFGG